MSDELCTCELVDLGEYHGSNAHPPEWDLDPACFEHGDPGCVWLDPMIQGQCSIDWFPGGPALAPVAVSAGAF